MSGPRPASITLSERQRYLLEHLRRCQAVPVRLARRVAVLLALADDPCLPRAAARPRLPRRSVRLSRRPAACPPPPPPCAPPAPPSASGATAGSAPPTACAPPKRAVRAGLARSD